jgi:glycosyltransferase involved in cell wall biosynthesis
LPNFTSVEDNHKKETNLKGIQGKRILCLANLRMQKNHFLLLEVAEKLKQTHPEWSFHLVGKDFEDEYSQKVRRFIEEKKLSNEVYVYGSKK